MHNAQATKPSNSTFYGSSVDANKVVINEINVGKGYVELYIKENVNLNGVCCRSIICLGGGDL
jgi:hypothetical protein